MSKKFIVGIDEVGRGPLAGPVVVCAVAMPTNLKSITYNLKTKLRDSKKLSPRQRELWFKYLTQHPKISYALAKVYPKTIDRINISRAANLATLRAFNKLTSNTYNLKPKNCRIYLDGGLYLGNSESLRRRRILLRRKIANCKSIEAKTIIKGDEKIIAIKIASIIAKVSRDRLMKKIAKKYPRYGFEIHKGYGTKIHLTALKKFGPSEIHRQSFLRFLK